MTSFNKLKENLKLRINNNVTEAKDSTSSSTTLIKPKTIAFEDWGFEKARNLNGSKTGLLACLALIREDHRQTAIKNDNEQKRLKEPLLAELESNNAQKLDKENKIEKIENITIKGKEKQIKELKKEIDDIKKDPTIIMKDKTSKVGFIIGSLILAAITLYLFVFYSSASYSAFFKTFTLNDIGVASSIFDPHALSNSFHDGFTELILIISMPFVFIGLGFLIHQFQKGKGIKKYFQIVSLVFVTFIFDVILAYEITEKIYNIKADNSFGDMPPYSFNLAFHSVNFWLIIFAGFVVYIIWGFVFDFVMESHDKLDFIKQAIQVRERNINTVKDEIKELKIKTSILEEDIEIIKEKNIVLNGKINGVIIDTTVFDRILHEFLQGWLHWMNANKLSQQKIDEARTIADEFIHVNVREIKINNVV